jgi:hypothetical protein
LISGINYTYLYSNQVTNQRRDFTFFRLSGEVAGTSVYLLNSAITLTTLILRDAINYSVRTMQIFQDRCRHTPLLSIFPEPFALLPGLLPVKRSIIGIQTLVPYIKQFYLGGTSSMRAWRVRSLGPGSYKDTSAVNFFNSAGDIKIEGNLEYRFNVLED